MSSDAQLVGADNDMVSSFSARLEELLSERPGCKAGVAGTTLVGSHLVLEVLADMEAQKADWSIHLEARFLCQVGSAYEDDFHCPSGVKEQVTLTATRGSLPSRRFDTAVVEAFPGLLVARKIAIAAVRPDLESKAKEILGGFSPRLRELESQIAAERRDYLFEILGWSCFADGRA